MTTQKVHRVNIIARSVAEAGEHIDWRTVAITIEEALKILDIQPLKIQIESTEEMEYGDAVEEEEQEVQEPPC